MSGGLHRGAEPTAAQHADDFDFPLRAGAPVVASSRRSRSRARALHAPPAPAAPGHLAAQQLPAQDFGALVGLSIHTLYLWKRRFEELGPAGLEDQRRGPQKGSRLSSRRSAPSC
ncbi:MAG: helix-turn-helix domain-containing protein [Planctomycetota bacterium]